MSVAKKRYIAPKYEMVVFDSQIMTAWSPGCWGVVGNNVEDISKPGSTCTVSYEPNLLAEEPNYWP